MMRIRGIGLLASALLLAGCSAGGEDGDQTPYEELYTTADTSEGYETNAPAPVTPVQGPEGPANVTETGPLTATGNLTGVAENAPPGSVTITEAGPGTQVNVKIDRYTVGTTLVATLVRGLCRQPGQPVAQVGEPFTVGPSGFATLTASVPVQARAVLDGQHSIRISTPGQGSPEFILACANLPTA